jgi:hypothetical protein
VYTLIALLSGLLTEIVLMANRVDDESFGRDDDQVRLGRYHARASFDAIAEQKDHFSDSHDLVETTSDIQVFWYRYTSDH